MGGAVWDVVNDGGIGQGGVMEDQAIIQALNEQVGCYRSLSKLAMIQHDHVQNNATEALLEVLTDFLKANNLKVDWEGVENAPNEALVNALAMMSPYGPPEKQAMLEAPDLKTRAEILIAVTEMDLAKKRTSGDPPLQ